MVEAEEPRAMRGQCIMRGDHCARKLVLALRRLAQDRQQDAHAVVARASHGTTSNPMPVSLAADIAFGGPSPMALCRGPAPVVSDSACKGETYPCLDGCLLYTSPSPRDATLSRMPSSA